MQKSLFSIHYTSIAAAFCLLIALAAGCTSDDCQLSDAGNANTGQTKEVVTQIPIKIALGDMVRKNSQITTRVLCLLE